MAPKAIVPKPSAQKPGGESSTAGQNVSSNLPLEVVANAPQPQQPYHDPFAIVGMLEDLDFTIVMQGNSHDMPILCLKPVGALSRLQFNSIAMMANRGELAPHHSAFITRPNRDWVQVVNGKIVRLHAGFYTIRTTSPTARTGPPFEFVIGRGVDNAPQNTARDVDILITHPTSRGYEAIKPEHCVIYLHPHSGVWMIKPRGLVLLDGQNISGRPEVALSKHQSVLQIGPLTYRIQFAIDILKSEDLYVQARDRRLQAIGHQLPETKISGLPLPTPVNARWRNQMATGEYSETHWDFHPTSGNLMIKKTLDIRDNHSYRSAELELRVLEKQAHLAKYYHVANSRGDTGIVPGLLNQTIHLDFLAGVRLRSLQYRNCDHRIRGLVQVAIAHQQLTILSQMHEEGWYHKRIKADNIRVYRVDIPPVKVETALIDMDSASKNWTHIPSSDEILPPEGYIEHELSNATEEREWQDFSDERLDIWMLGHAFAKLFFPDCFRRDEAEATGPPPYTFLKPNDAQEYPRVIRKLMETEDLLASSLCAMLDWDPDKRPRAEIALKHRVFDVLKDQEQPVGINVTSLV